MPIEANRESSASSRAPRIASRVVVAYGDEAMRSYVAEPLRRRGYEVVELKDGYELIEFLSVQVLARSRCLGAPSIAPFAVVADIDMPGHDGLSLVGDIRKAGWHIPVILVSSREERRVYDEAERLESDALFHEPFDVHFLCDTVEALVRRGAT